MLFRSQKKYKIAFVGPSSAGKTSIILRFHKDHFSSITEPTIGAAFLPHVLNLENSSIVLHLWDTAGQELYKSLVPMYSRGAAAVIVVFDLSSKYSFEDAKVWCNQIETDSENTEIFLVGNKTDLETTLSLEEIQDYSIKNKLIFKTTSAKLGTGINELFFEIANKVSQKITICEGKDITVENVINVDENKCCSSV